MENITGNAMDEIKGLSKETRLYIVREFTVICQRFVSAIEGKDIEALKDELWRVNSAVRRLLP